MKSGNNPNTEDMPVAVCVVEGYDKKIPFILSKWKLTPEELEHVKRTGEIWISIMGAGMPPIMPLVEDPFIAHGFKPLTL